jgi:hypothetical protein
MQFRLLGEQVMEIYSCLTDFQDNEFWQMVMNWLHYFDLSEEFGALWACFEVGPENRR